MALSSRRPARDALTVEVQPCEADAACFRWAILSAGGACLERSAYAYASALGARVVGEIRRSELRYAAPARDPGP